MKTTCFFMVLVICLNGMTQDIDYSLNVAHSVTFADMKWGFKEVPDEAKTKVYMFWLDGLIDKKTITRDFEEIKAKGFGGILISDCKGGVGRGSVDVLPPPVSRPLKLLPLTFGGEEWLSMLAHATKEADRLGLELSLQPQSGYMLGGPSVTTEEGMKIVVFSEQSIKGPQKIKLKVSYPDTILFYEDIIIQAIKTNAEAGSERGILNWDLKSFNKGMGSSGIYPLYKYSTEEKDTPSDYFVKKDEIVDLTPHFKNGIL